jgi:hypothetical protein
MFIELYRGARNISITELITGGSFGFCSVGLFVSSQLTVFLH